MNRKGLIKNIRNFGSEFVMTTIAQSLYLLQSVVQNKIFTSYFEQSIFGKWSLLVSAYTLVSMIPFSAIDQGIYKTAYSTKNDNKERQLYSLIAIFYSLGFFIYTIVFLIMNVIQKERFFAFGYALPFALYSFSEIIKNTFVIIDNAYRNRKRVLIIRIFGFSSRTILFLVFHYIGWFSLKNVLWILFITNIAMLVYQKQYYCHITLKIDKTYCKQIAKSILKFSAPLMTWAIFGWMQNMISRWYLDSFLDLNAVALYSVLTTLSFFVPNAVYTVVNAYVMPIVFQKNRPFSRKSLLKYIGIVFAPLFVYWIGICFLGRYLVLLMTDSKYLEVCNYLPYTTLSAIIYALAMLSTVEIYRRAETKKLLVSTILPGLFMATVGLVLIKNLGITGAVINYIAGHVIYAILTFLIVFNKKNIAQQS